MSKKSFFGGLKEGVRLFGNNIATIVNTVLLFAAYVVGIGLTWLVARIVGKHFLKTKIQKRAKTYWEPLNLKKKSIENYYRQF